MNYIALIHKENNSDYGVSFPDFPGCITAGKTLDESKTMAQEAITTHVEILREMGEHINPPSSLEEIMQNREDKEAVAFLVNVPSEKAIRVNITVPEDNLITIDKRAKKYHMTRSAFFAEAAMKYRKI
ncbi:MAG: CopG family transcriptional regulator [Alphaproteobacteria bacterium 16-39-46]|nr:MAG: CopG family transcriptional regulator [Alphaproteobacteria bacterium 16-39-46]OZA43850.1 MAG: CopG family transcriptional regulator [Alphaproteobacteria bacterium 17-39-52]HQS84091.1 type II toxin-antitoxin system HicB family antitoxin [Alphaproteobacteria bacterium]HQS93965.1 type II toxin-antitoxin system HicB family antitoxin [Alphaproteobacteria bacterium]